ncbi:DUF4843 domain-containing protein [Belliella kenyensis]|uniref:DUF4843 domain-containing protein n=1 Tax=Belliella kenyensis TaxID=1472724 RepID=A0ABV8EQS8_9BACT|nr:DUF4843 domain-containing protein [Belliella kenyensis]MCH7402866.1 DUF4843 domain-containing protein [Belliella kenyensis]MDN3602572.1 DUF4843 domain-containing protein [Belliella kenyensis]
MKNLKYIIFLILCSLTTTACFEVYEDRYYFTDKLVEFQNAVVTNNATGRNYPLINQRSVGTVRYQVNLIGGHLAQDQVINYRILEEESNAQSGVHYNIANVGSFTIPANSSFGFIEVERLAFQRPGTTNFILVLELTGNENVAPSNNYMRIGISL